MALDLIQLDTDLDSIISDLPVTVVTDYDTVTGTKSSNRRMNNLIEQGLEETIDFNVYLQASDLTTEPDVDDIVTIASVEYRIVNITRDDTDQLIRLDLSEKFSDG